MIRKIQRMLENPWLLPLAISHRFYRKTGRDNALAVMDADWDNLIILDACRFDIFKSCWEGPGELTSVTSLGSNTPEWLRRNFTDSYADTVYVTGNPQVQANNTDDHFHATIDAWKTNWDDELRTVHPRDMADKTLQAVQDYDNKRIISHWIQPHYPFIGETGQQIDHGSLTGNGELQDSRKVESIWKQLEQSLLSKETIQKMYKENLEMAIPELHRTIKGLDGRTVVTSDHGNVFGKYGLYGHPGCKFVEELVKVPWLVLDGERRNIVSGSLDGSSDEVETIEDRLSDLGYL